VNCMRVPGAPNHTWIENSQSLGCGAPLSMISSSTVRRGFMMLTRACQRVLAATSEKLGVVKSSVSGFGQTVRFLPTRVCAVPLWMLQVPRPEARPVHNAREFCVRIGSKIKS
jgi:hypothetical protein